MVKFIISYDLCINHISLITGYKHSHTLTYFSHVTILSKYIKSRSIGEYLPTYYFFIIVFY